MEAVKCVLRVSALLGGRGARLMFFGKAEDDGGGIGLRVVDLVGRFLVVSLCFLNWLENLLLSWLFFTVAGFGRFS